MLSSFTPFSDSPIERWDTPRSPLLPLYLTRTKDVIPLQRNKPAEHHLDISVELRLQQAAKFFDEIGSYFTTQQRINFLAWHIGADIQLVWDLWLPSRIVPQASSGLTEQQVRERLHVFVRAFMSLKALSFVYNSSNHESKPGEEHCTLEKFHPQFSHHFFWPTEIFDIRTFVREYNSLPHNFERAKWLYKQTGQNIFYKLFQGAHIPLAPEDFLNCSVADFNQQHFHTDWYNQSGMRFPGGDFTGPSYTFLSIHQHNGDIWGLRICEDKAEYCSELPEWWIVTPITGHVVDRR